MRDAAIPGTADHSLLYLVYTRRLVACCAYRLPLGLVREGVTRRVLLGFVAPLLTAVLAWKLRSQRALSVFHRRAFFGCASYPRAETPSTG
jgi:hypothetical protein